VWQVIDGIRDAHGRHEPSGASAAPMPAHPRTPIALIELTDPERLSVVGACASARQAHDVAIGIRRQS